MSLRHPFKPPRSKETARQTKAREVEIDTMLAKDDRPWMARRIVGRQTAAVVEPDTEGTETHIHSGARRATVVVVRQSVLTEEEPNSPPPKDVANHGVIDWTTPISEWAVSEDEDDSVPISQLIGKDKAKEVQALGNVTELYVDAELPPLFQIGHSNLDKNVAKFFDKVLHFGTVTEIIPRRKGFHYGITYNDGDKEDMDDDELQYALELNHKNDVGDECVDEAAVHSDINGLNEEGSVYDSEEDRRELQKLKKRKAAEPNSKRALKKSTPSKTKFKVHLENVANIGGPDSMLGKSMARFIASLIQCFHLCVSSLTKILTCAV
jgi:hypothetical protein